MTKNLTALDGPEEQTHDSGPNAASGVDQFLLDTIRIRYQPVIRFAGMRPEYMEVLARAEAADGTLFGPESIVDAMTGSEISMALTGAILQKMLDEYGECDLAATPLSFAMNLPLDALLHPDLIEIVEGIRTRNFLEAARISFELTERHPVRDIPRVGKVITILREAGYGLALDDVTPDMPNLPALLTLPIKSIKLDRSVVTGETASMRGFIAHIVAQAGAMDVIAEGIETPETMQAMRALGVSHGQGFLFAQPMAGSEIKDFLAGCGAPPA